MGLELGLGLGLGLGLELGLGIPEVGFGTCVELGATAVDQVDTREMIHLGDLLWVGRVRVRVRMRVFGSGLGLVDLLCTDVLDKGFWPPHTTLDSGIVTEKHALPPMHHTDTCHHARRVDLRD